MILDAGYKGFGMFELGRVGIFIALAGIVYLLFFSSRLLPEVRKDTVGDEHGEADASSFHRVEAVIGARSRVSIKGWGILILSVIMVLK